MPKFLKIPERTKKPREYGLTCVLDKGLGMNEVQDILETAEPYIDIVKLGWGTGYITKDIKPKIGLYQKYGISVCMGGTLFEVAVIQNKVDEYCNWLKELGIGYVELSEGTIQLPVDRRLELIRALSKNFRVLSEVGSKDILVVMAPYKWVDSIKGDLDAGSWKVITEGRESGTVGVFRQSGEIRTGLIEEITKGVDYEDLIFEAPQKSQQAWFINEFGPNVNLGNIAASEVIPLETLRLGLRADTLPKFHLSPEQTKASQD
jgi:phosphosulfolactate synthase